MSEYGQVALARSKAAQIARTVAEGTLSPILGARQLCALRAHVAVAHDDADFLCMTVVDSDTDALPVGAERSQWDAAALHRKAQEIAEAEAQALRSSREAFKRIATRWGAAAEQADAADEARKSRR